ncbi:hypothetical protein EV175_000397 [Coemansia sp. RSA 1933]|nr:hypothetical protein EV175_000397 [Coemansia sp. RSA 1933]
MACSAKEESAVQSATSAKAQARSSLGLFADEKSPTTTKPAKPAAPQRNVTVTGASSTARVARQSGGGDDDAENMKESDRRRRRASRRQSEDTMHAMRSLDRQYGRRRRLNSDFHEKATELMVGHKSLGMGAQSRSSSTTLKRGDSRMLFAPVLCRPHAETVTTTAGRPTPALPGDEAATAADDGGVRQVATSRRSAHQLMLLAGRMAQHQQQKKLSGSGRLAENSVRPRASMPLINGVPHRAPQRTRSQATRKHRDEELSGALTMKSVEIRGGRIVLDNPSSSEEGEGSDGSDSDDSYVDMGRNEGGRDESEAARLFGSHRHRRRLTRMGSANTAPATGDTAMGGAIGAVQRPSIGALSVCSTQSADVAWDDVLRRQWYTRRCLGLRQSFDSVHRLAKAEHDSQAPFPLLNDLRRVLVETHGCILRVDGGDAEPVDVLLCSDAIVLCAACHQPPGTEPLRAVEFGDDLVVRVMDGAEDSVCITGDEDNPGQQLVLAFAHSDGAREWAEQVVQARTRLCSALQDLRLDEEDYVDRPPLPLLARGRSSIAGTTVDNAALGSVARMRMRNAAQGGIYWVPDAETAVCMVCQTTVFSMMVRRHHCRACGLVICYRCSAVDASRRRLCVRCWNPRTTAHPPLPPAGPGASSSSAAAPTASASASASASAAGPRLSPSLATLGRRAAEYLPAGDVVMQLAAASETPTPNDSDPPPVRKKADARLARRPISSLFPLEPEPDQ